MEIKYFVMNRTISERNVVAGNISILFSGVTSLPLSTKVGHLEEVKLSRGYIWLQWRIGELSIN
jgi:hypothetical protein